MTQWLRHLFGKSPAFQAIPILLLFVGVFILTQAEQTNFWSIALGYGTAFSGFFLFVITMKPQRLIGVIFLAIGLRVICLFDLPNLSDDYYRFYWDGKCMANGVSPFEELPTELIEKRAFIEGWEAHRVLEGMNSPDYYSVYPPVSQIVFRLSAMFNLESGVLAMRLIILLADLGSIWLLFQLLPLFGMAKEKFAWFAFNPLVVFEFTGSLHFEGLMIFFGLLAIWAWKKHRKLLFVIATSLSIATKLIPLIFLPFLFRKVKPLKAIGIGAIIGALTIAFFLPFISKEVLLNFGSSLDLYFQKFEFNASIFYLVREVGISIQGWNPISTIGPALSIIAFVLILFIAFYRKQKFNNIFLAMTLALTVHFAFATTVHPWYIGTVFTLSLFVPMRFAILWTGTATLSYFFYHHGALEENYWVLSLQYVPVYALLIADLKKLNKHQTDDPKLTPNAV